MCNWPGPMRGRTAIRVVVIALALIGVGCETYDPLAHYDPGAIEKVARVINKQVARYEMREHAETRPNFWTDKHSGIAVYVLASLIEATHGKVGSSAIAIYAYSIEADDGERAVVYSEYPGFEIGNCVKLFLSHRADYPRMAPWSCGAPGSIRPA